MLTKALIVLGYYLVAFVGVAVWTFRDFESTRKRVEKATFGVERLADRFLARTSVTFGVTAGIGAALLMQLLLTPPPAPWVVAAVALGALALTAAGVQALIRIWPRMGRTDPLAELRTHAAARDADGMFGLAGERPRD